jgi:protein CMS1
MPYPTGLVSSRKRTRPQLPEGPSQPSPAEPKRKRAKRKKKGVEQKECAGDGEDFDRTRGLNLAIARMPPQLLSDYAAARTRRAAEPGWTDEEIEALRIPGTSPNTRAKPNRRLPAPWRESRAFMLTWSPGKAHAIRDATAWPSERTLDNLAPFLESMADGRGMDSVKEQGCPHTLVVAAAGLRAADIARSV